MPGGKRMSEYDDGSCCTPDSGDCCGPGSWCCKRAGKHDHDEEDLETFADRMARRSLDAVQADSWKAKQ
jgi:hypothetical protein